MIIRLLFVCIAVSATPNSILLFSYRTDAEVLHSTASVTNSSSAAGAKMTPLAGYPLISAKAHKIADSGASNTIRCNYYDRLKLRSLLRSKEMSSKMRCRDGVSDLEKSLLLSIAKSSRTCERCRAGAKG